MVSPVQRSASGRCSSAALNFEADEKSGGYTVRAGTGLNLPGLSLCELDESENFKKPRCIVALASLTPDVSIPAAQAKYDLVIRNGRIVDGTGNPWFYGDVAVNEDRIVSVGPGAGEAKREIDARGLVVAPGFIDMHSHSDWLLLEDGNAQSKIRQGVTTEVIGEDSSAGPFKGKLAAHTVSVKDQAKQIRTLGEYFAAIESSGISVNVASYVGERTIWECVGDLRSTGPDQRVAKDERRSPR
jgi:hypothetical protein